MELHQYLRSLRERWLSGLLAALLVAGIVAALTATAAPEYRATNEVFVQARTGGGAADLNSSASFAGQQISSYAGLATTPFVLDEVIADLGLDTTPAALAEQVSVSVTEGSFIIEITATSQDPLLAASIADSTAAHLQEAVESLDSGTAASTVVLRVVSPAVVPESPYSPDPLRNAVLGGVLALLVGVGTALFRSLLNTRVRTTEDLQNGTGRVVLGTIPASRGRENASRVLLDSPHGAAAESYRELRTNLQFVKLANGRRSILVTSSLEGEGKSTCAVNLAQVLARSGSRVLLIDADLRCPSVHGMLGLEGGAGLTTVLIGHAELADVTQPGGTDGLDVITAGTIPPNPSELLGSAAMEDVLREAARHYEVILVDAPPVLAVTDAAVLSRITGGVLVVAQNERVRRAEFERTMAKLQAVDATIVGMVLNRVRGAQGGSAYVYGGAERSTEELDDVATPVHAAPDDAPVASRRRIPAGSHPSEEGDDRARPSASDSAEAEGISDSGERVLVRVGARRGHR